MPEITTIPIQIEKAIRDTFRIQLKSRAWVSKLTTDSQGFFSRQLSVDCLSTIAFQSPSFEGQLAMAFPRSTCLRLLERLLDEKVEDLSIDNSDGVSEILNIVFNSSRRAINENGFDFRPALPSTVIGNSIEISNSFLIKRPLIFECESDLGEFLVILILQPVAFNQAS